MGSYKLYLAVMAIAVIAAVQEISCKVQTSEQDDDQEGYYDDEGGVNDNQGEENDNQGEENDNQGEENDNQGEEKEEVSEPEMEHHQCEEYKSKIWNDAFSNPKAMNLMKLTFNTAKELGSNEVCSDTTRALFNFVDVMATSPYAHFSLGMFNKMVAFILREVDTTSDKFKETKQVVDRISKTPEIRDYIRNSAAKTVDLLKEPKIRARLFRVMKAFESLIKPNENEALIKQKIKGLTNAPVKLAKGAMKTVGRFFRHF
ncbi:uncharacterized protein LOC111031105 [Myzus persicae]|uniref:Acid trehalase n=1 Tax=Aphis gossypii TaxID=80765 RepID=A0A023SGK7_APHGO|nr:uncharacterized protein LOC111031105 [Myzus persicae]AHX71990.1 acid trehalase [Aphis gossypii]